MGRLLSFLCFLLPLSTIAAVKVTIDPGHGGVDRGAVYDGVLESQVVFAVAEKLAHQLETNKSVKTNLTRNADHRLSLGDRVHKAEAAGAQLFVSLHANAAPESWVKGFEIFVYPPLSKGPQRNVASKNETAETVKTILEDLTQQSRFFKSIKASEQISDRFSGPIKAGDFYVLRENKIPAILVEIGFLSNPRERQRLTKPEFQTEMAIKMAEAVNAAIEKLGLQSEDSTTIL